MTTVVQRKQDTQALLACSDAELMARIQQGDINAYEGIMRRYNQRLYRVTRSILNNDAAAMDAMQEAYIKAFEQLEMLQNIEALPTWLSRIARNEALQNLRRNQRTLFMSPEQLEPVLEFSMMKKKTALPEDELANHQLGQLLQQCIEKLPDAFRSVYVLRAIEQCSVLETSDILDIPQATVKTRYFRANALLQQQLNQQIQKSDLTLYEFAGHRCDAVVQNVLERLTGEA